MMFNRLPAAYRRGSVLQKLRHDLAGLEFAPDDDTRARFRCGKTGLEVLAEERVEPRFLMHIVTTHFSYPVSRDGGALARIGIRHRGAWKRTGIECVVARGAQDGPVRDAAERIAADAAFTAAALPLDFTDFQLERQSGGWLASLVHYGASEVVYHFPSTRQYVRLPPEQVPAILKTFARLRDLLNQGLD
jgi:hypothetical protein